MSLLILTASAGSGKTYRLTQEYLKLALSHHPRYFSKILGMTFTNKAAWEMKESILNELDTLSKYPDQSNHFPNLRDALKLTEEQIKGRAGRVQKAVLQNYHDFSLSTIDSFFQRVVRAFFRELGLASNFDVELDKDQVVKDAISEYIRDMKAEDPLIQHISRIQGERFEAEKSNNFMTDLVKRSNELFKEIQLPDTIGNDEKLKEIQNSLYAQNINLEGEYSDFQNRTVSFLEKYDLTGNDYSGKGKSFINWFLNRDLFCFIIDTGKGFEKALEDPDTQIAKSVKGAQRLQMEACNRELHPLLLELSARFKSSGGETYLTNRLMLNDFNSFAVLSYLNKIINRYTSRENIFLLNKTYRLLRGFMTESDSPLIFERIGSRYRHLFIDEFQDTSRYQYENIKPLLDESLATGNFNLVVGDVKQSIYRFRNGDWKLLGGEVMRDFSQTTIESLSDNWRSAPEIIDFNNKLFSDLSENMQYSFESLAEDFFNSKTRPEDLSFIQKQFHGDALKQHFPRQKKPENSPPGHVQIEFLAGDPKEQTLLDLLYERIEKQLLELEEKGFQAGDIAILTRTGGQIRNLIPRLAASSKAHPDSRIFNFFSEEVLSIADSPVAQVVLSVMRLAAWGLYHKREKQRILLNLIYFFKKAGVKLPVDLKEKDLYFDHISQLPDDLAKLVTEGPTMGLNGFFYRIVSDLQLGKKEWAPQYYYLTALGDEISNYAAQKGNDLMGFLEYWEEKGSEKSIEPPSDPNKMRLMTIHKSKGLAFQIVIIPFAAIYLNHGSNAPVVWVKDDRFNIEGQPLSFPIEMVTAASKSLFREDYWRELYYRWIDEINAFYVGVTRPRQALFIYSFSNKKSLQNPSYFSCHLYNFAKTHMDHLSSVETDSGEIELMVKDVKHYPLLKKKTSEKEKKEGSSASLDLISATGLLPRVKSQWKSTVLCSGPKEGRTAVEEGLMMHRILERVVGKDDLKKAILSNIEEGYIPQGEYDHWYERIQKALSISPVSNWFRKGPEVLNERDILLPDGSRYRPDRVVIEGQKAILIDFKTGQPRDRYKHQLRIYADTLKTMGYSQTEGWLFYTDALKTEQII